MPPPTIFLSTPSARRATGGSTRCGHPHAYFYPRPPRGGRPTGTLGTSAPGNFYPRPPRGGRRTFRTFSASGYVFLSTPSARRATGYAGSLTGSGEISIHALREEGDKDAQRSIAAGRLFLSTPSARRATMVCKTTVKAAEISIHALREEGDTAAA